MIVATKCKRSIPTRAGEPLALLSPVDGLLGLEYASLLENLEAPVTVDDHDPVGTSLLALGDHPRCALLLGVLAGVLTDLLDGRARDGGGLLVFALDDELVCDEDIRLMWTPEPDAPGHACYMVLLGLASGCCSLATQKIHLQRPKQRIQR